MAPPALALPYCETPVGLQSVYCHQNGTSIHGHEIFIDEIWDQIFGKGANATYQEPHFAALLDPKIKNGGDAAANVAVDNSDHSVVGVSFDFEQSLATIGIVFAILGIIYFIRSGSERICHTAKTHFGEEAKYRLERGERRTPSPNMTPRNYRNEQDTLYPNTARPPPPAMEGIAGASSGE